MGTIRFKNCARVGCFFKFQILVWFSTFFIPIFKWLICTSLQLSELTLLRPSSSTGKVGCEDVGAAVSGAETFSFLAVPGGWARDFHAAISES